MVPPTMTAGADWQYPTSTQYSIPKTFTGLAAKSNLYEKPFFNALKTAQYLVQNIVSSPQTYDISRANIQGGPQGGTISGLELKKMLSRGTSRGLRFMPAEFNYLKNAGIFSVTNTQPQYVTINLNTLHNIMSKEIGQDIAKDQLAGAADQFLAQMVTHTGSTTPIQNRSYTA